MFLIIVKSSQFLSRFVLSPFGFQTFGCNPSFSLCSLFVPLVSHNQDAILSSIIGHPNFLRFSINGMPSQFPFKLISLLFLFLIIEMSSQVLFVLQFKLICLFLCFLLITTPSQFVSMFVLSSFAFSSLRCRSRSHHHLDNILGSICVHFYFLRFPIIGMSSQVLYRLMFVLFITYHWNAFLGFLYVYYQFPQFPILVPLVYLHQDAIVGSIYVQFQFLWFPFIWMSSQFLSKLSCFFLWFAIIGTPFQLHLCSKLVPLVMIMEMQSQVSTLSQLVVSLVSHY